jgi:hypothetical protein
MFLRQNKTNLKEADERREYEYAIERVYAHKRIDLAIAGMCYYDAYSFRKDVLGNKVRVPDNFNMSGVVHEPFDGLKRIICKIEFFDREPEQEIIGFCALSHSIEDERQKPETRKLFLQVSIWDASREWWKKSYNALRDAAISGNRFLHFGIEKETADKAVALTQIRGSGCGPSLKLHEFAMWPTIILPKAPDWALKL